MNLHAAHAGSERGQGVVRMVVDKLGVAKKVVAARGWRPEEEEVLELEPSDKPGTLGEVARTLGEAYVSVTTADAKKAMAFLAVSDMTKALLALW